MNTSTILNEDYEDEQYFVPNGFDRFSSVFQCICSNTIIKGKKYECLVNRWDVHMPHIFNTREFIEIMKECNLKLVNIVQIDHIEEDQTVYNIEDVFIHINCFFNPIHYIYDIELIENSRIKLAGDKILINEYKKTNKREITLLGLRNIEFDRQIHDYMYIDNNIVDCCICIKKPYKRHRVCNSQSVKDGKHFKNRNLRYISFDKLNIIYMTNGGKSCNDNFTKFIEISDFVQIVHEYRKNIRMIDFIYDYVYDVEIYDDAQIYNLPRMYMCDSIKIKLINKRKLIDDLLLLSYLYYYLFCNNIVYCNNMVLCKNTFDNIFFRNILGYFVEDTFEVKINKMIDLFFNSRAYLLELEEIKQGLNPNTYINIDIYILSLFNTEYEPMKEECNRQCIEFIKSLLDTIMNRKHILIKNFNDEELKKLYDRIIKCITINKCVETSIIETLGMQFEKLKIKDGL